MKRTFLAAGVGALLAAAVPAGAQQVFIKRLYVHSYDNHCTVNTTHNTLSCPAPTTAGDRCPSQGNISNNPRIEFDQGDAADHAGCTDAVVKNLFPGSVAKNACNSRVILCAQIGWGNKQAGSTDIALDYINFEIFKFGNGTNPLDPASAPPLRTFFVDDPGVIPANTTSDEQPDLLAPTCVIWDGDVNILGEFGKSNGQFGFRTTVNTNQTNATSGNITIQMTRAYPSGFTYAELDGGGCTSEFADQKPITVDVVNVHVVRTTPTVVGELTGVAAEPYNITYRLSKDASVSLEINKAVAGLPLVRTVVPFLPRVGEGVPSGTLQNGDAWNGRYDNGDLSLPGVYLANIQASARDEFGDDTSKVASRQIMLDPLQVTDIRVQPLLDLSTSLAVISYTLTEPATVYIDIYPPGTQFSNGLNSLNNAALDQNPAANYGVPKNFLPSAGLVRHIEEQKDFRRTVLNIWDGRDRNGNVVPDGDYKFVIYASLPSQNGLAFSFPPYDKRIWSSNARSGFISVSRGLVTISQVTPSSSMIGSSPTVAGLDPFSFNYTLSRDAFVTMKIMDSSGRSVIRTLVDHEQRPGNLLNRERWVLPLDDAGLWVSSGIYLVQLEAQDPFIPAKISTTTAQFPVNCFRIADVNATPLLTGSTDVVTLSYQLSQPMNMVWNIYPPGTVVTGAAGAWPPCGTLEPGNSCAQITMGQAGPTTGPIITVKGMRPGRLKITEFWDGRDPNGLFVPDGNYVFTLAAQSTTTPRYFTTDRIVGQVTVARGSVIFPIFSVTPTIPTLYNSSQTVSLPPYEIEYSLTRQSSVTIQILNTSVPPLVIRDLITGQVRDSNVEIRDFWDGRDNYSNFVAPGFYTVRAVAEDLASSLASGSTAQQTISVNPLRIYDVAVSPLRQETGSALIAYQVSETMKVSIKVFKPITTFDKNGNPTPPERTSLIKRIVGVRPARTEISDVWDGTDETMTMLPDGNYIFKIQASTDINSIDSLTGDVRTGAPMAEDLIIAEVPLVRGASLDPSGEFENNTIIYPNPMTAATANFRIFVPFEANVRMKIYTLSGELVYDKDFGRRPPNENCSLEAAGLNPCLTFSWNKTNMSGNPLAHGVYFALIREEPVKGERSPLQTVKKFLIP
jgi:flagellar hook assembly protein FlgD